MKKSFLVLIISFLSISAWAKKNVCAITINSNHEINLFKKSLSKEQWNFVELTDYADKDTKNSAPNSWFLNSCNAKVSCDILIISGHFGGTFFGESAFKLPLEELEKNTCNTSCDGIIDQPKEVFLFGCNTLAGKEKDQRSPEEYLLVLMDDGFTRQQAEQVVAFRYSALGNSFSSRMSQVFQNTPRIYGFSSIGPSGKTVEPLLNKYLQSTKAEYQNFDKFNHTIKSETNKKLFTALKDSAIAQTAGLTVSNPSLKNVDRPYCYLENKDVSRYNKLKYITEVLLSGRSLTMIPYIKDFIHALVEKNDISAEEKLLLQQISSSEQVKADFTKITNLEGDVYLGIKINTFKLMQDLSLVTNAEYQKFISNIVDFSQKITIEKRDQICSLEIQLDIDPQKVSQENLKNRSFLSIVECLKPKNENFQLMIADLLKNDENPMIRSGAALALGRIKPTSETIHMLIAESMKYDKLDSVRQQATYSLADIGTKNQYIHLMITEIMQNDKNEAVRHAAALTLEIIKPTSETIHMMIAETMMKGNNENVRSAAARLLGEIEPNETIQLMIAETKKNDKSERVRKDASRALELINQSEAP